MIVAQICSLLILLTPAELEASGQLPEAGAAWEEAGSIHGQARIMCRMLEEALYAGDGERAYLLMEELEPVCSDRGLPVYWRARLAWSAGLLETAQEELSEVVTEDPWLLHRAAGTLALYRGSGMEAEKEFLLSIQAASTSRRRFYSGIDLCLAYLQQEKTEEALSLSELLLYGYQGDALARVMYGLCLHRNGQYSRAAGVLMGSFDSSASARSIAELLLEGFEQ